MNIGDDHDLDDITDVNKSARIIYIRRGQETKDRPIEEDGPKASGKRTTRED
jgi:hypothetical protein